MVEAKAGLDTRGCIPPKLGSALPFSINVIKWVGSLFISGLLHSFIHINSDMVTS